MSENLCLNGHEIQEGFRFCVDCGAERQPAMEEVADVASEDHLVITVNDLPSTATPIPGSIAHLEMEAAPEVPSSPVEDPAAETESIYERDMRTQKARDEAYEELEALEGLAQTIHDWELRNNNSFLAKTTSVMRQNLAQADGLLDNYNRIVESLAIPEPGEMAKLRKSFHRKLLWSTILVPAITYLIYRIPRLPNKWVRENLSSLVFNPRPLIVYAIIIYIALVLGALITYYRGWSTYQRRVITTLWNLQNVSTNVEHVRSEQARLKALYPQVNEWLVILGHSLTNPWRLRKEWFESSIGDISEDSLPNSLRIAQAQEDDGPAMLGMQRYAAERFMTRGWRANVFGDQIDVIRQSLGMPKDRLNVDILDQDILYSPNGPRALVRTNITNQGILEQIGRRQLLPLIAEVQKEAITKSRPPVNEIRKEGIKTTKVAAEDEGISELTPWDEFLSLSIPVEGKPRTPLSVFSLSDSGKIGAHHDKYKTFIIVPERLKGRVAGVEERHLKTYTETTKLPMDVVVRADFSGPIPPEDLLFLNQTSTTRGAIKKEEKSEKPAPKFDPKRGV
jgi:hypothetical protein